MLAVLVAEVIVTEVAEAALGTALPVMLLVPAMSIRGHCRVL